MGERRGAVEKTPWDKIYYGEGMSKVPMSKYIDHERAFMETHIHDRPAAKILATIVIIKAVFGNSPQRATFQNKCFEFAACVILTFPFLFEWRHAQICIRIDSYQHICILI